MDFSSGGGEKLDSSVLIKFGKKEEVVATPKVLLKELAGAEKICEDSYTNLDEITEILNSTVPPRVWDAEGKIWQQTLSRDGATRLDVINLKKNLDALLSERQARNYGICPVRRDLFTSCFDEVIRQVAINSPDRGLLLLRVRDEIRMTLAGYQALYENAVWYGRSNADEGYENKEELLKHYRDIENKVLEARVEVEEMRLEVDATRRTLKERREMDAKRHAEEVQFIKRANQQIKQETESLIEYGKRPSTMLN